MNDTTDNLVEGDYIGTDVTGTVAIPNTGAGVEIDSGASGNTIGGITSSPGTGAGNVISGNATGVSDSGGGDDVFEGNLIGLQAGGLAALPNTSGGIGAGALATPSAARRPARATLFRGTAIPASRSPEASLSWVI